jgi:hypothetical protein
MMAAALGAADAPAVAAKTSEWNVSDFGAVAGGAQDCTAAFQKALDAACAANGGVVFAPTGRYRFDGVLTVPHDVTLRGVFPYSPSHAGIRDKSPELPVYGSVLEPYANAGTEEGPAFITLQSNATLQGFTVHYPDQKPDATEPTKYPYAVALRGNNPAVTDVELLNPYNGIDAAKNQRALVRNIHGQPIHIGVWVDEIYDIGRIENVHWNPWWTMGTPVYEWQMAHGVGFLFGRTDWHYVLDTFCFGYHVGYHFTKTKAGGTNGNFLGIGADNCETAVIVEETQPMGLMITNGEFVSFLGPDPTMVRVTKSHTGTVRFTNCAFWGPCNRNAVIDGFGTVGFGDCTFVQWGHQVGKEAGSAEDAPSIDVLSGSVLVRGCEFMEDKPQILLHKGCARAVITDNLLLGKKRIKNDSKGNVVVKNNVTTPDSKAWRDGSAAGPGPRGDLLRRNMRKKMQEKNDKKDK